MSKILLIPEPIAGVPAPPAGTKTLVIDDADGRLKLKDSIGAVEDVGDQAFIKTIHLFGDFSDAGMTFSVDSVLLPPGYLFKTHVIKRTQVFASPGIASLEIQLGIAGALDKYDSGIDALAAPTDTDMVVGVNGVFEDWAAAEQLLVTLVADAGLDSLTSGSFEVYHEIGKVKS